MQQKKSPKKDVRKWSLIFFQVGLILVMLISWRAIENKTYDKKEKKDDVPTLRFNDLEPEDVVVVQQPKTNTPPPPPPPPEAPKEIKIVDNDAEIEEDVVETVEDIPEPKVEIADISEIQSVPSEGEVVEEIAEVPFQAIQDVPIFPGCEKYDDAADRKNCMSEKVRKFVNRRFNTDLGRELGLQGRISIYVQFTVDEHGDITDVHARAPQPQLKEEAIRVVGMLPKMTPGKQRGKAVRVIYTLPIVFQVR